MLICNSPLLGNAPPGNFVKFHDTKSIVLDHGRTSQVSPACRPDLNAMPVLCRNKWARSDATALEKIGGSDAGLVVAERGHWRAAAFALGALATAGTPVAGERCIDVHHLISSS